MRLNSVRVVRPMISRMHAAASILAFSLLALAPNESFARGFGARPFPIASAGHMVFRPPHHAPQFFRHRRPIRTGLAAIAPYSYAPSDYGFPYYQPSFSDPETLSDAFPTRLGPAETHSPGCRSYPVTVPSESGGTRLINTLRC
jgi:hypothetical protein